MDKENLFYIVALSTNSRILNKEGNPLIVQPNRIQELLDKLGIPYVKISIEEYERTFTEQDETHSK